MLLFIIGNRASRARAVGVFFPLAPHGCNVRQRTLLIRPACLNEMRFLHKVQANFEGIFASRLRIISFQIVAYLKIAVCGLKLRPDVSLQSRLTQLEVCAMGQNRRLPNSVRGDKA